MPSHRAQIVPRYPEGYRTLPRNTKTRPESLCSVTPSVYDKTLPGEDKRRSMRDDTMWQLYEWQQRQFYNKQTTLTRHGTLSSPQTMINISDQTMHMIPTSPSHGSIAGFQGYSPQRSYRSEVSSPAHRGDVTIDRRQRPHQAKVKDWACFHMGLFAGTKRATMNLPFYSILILFSNGEFITVLPINTIWIATTIERGIGKNQI